MTLRICVAGVTGWTGSMVAKALATTPDSALAAGIARSRTGEDLGLALGLPRQGVAIAHDLQESLATPFDLLIDFTRPDSVKARTRQAISA